MVGLGEGIRPAPALMVAGMAGEGTAPLVSVVVPAFNEEAAIEACLDSICGQDYERLEVIVVDGASTDTTVGRVAAYATKDPRVRLIHNPDRIIPVSLNRAVEAARGEFLVRVDAHAAIPRDYVSRCVLHLMSGRWCGVGGRKNGVGRTTQGRAIAAALASPFGVGASKYHYGEEPQIVDHVPFGAYPLSIVRQLGGWDERLAVNQDFEFDFRVRSSGREILFDPALSIDWECRQTLRDLWKQYFRYGRGKAKVVAIHPSSARLRHLAVPAYVLALLVAFALAPVSPVVLAAVVSPYVAFLATGTLITSRRVGTIGVAVLLPLTFAVMHLAWGLGFLRGIPDGVTVLRVIGAQSARGATS